MTIDDLTPQEKEFYEKPSVKKRKKAEAARKRSRN